MYCSHYFQHTQHLRRVRPQGTRRAPAVSAEGGAGAPQAASPSGPRRTTRPILLRLLGAEGAPWVRSRVPDTVTSFRTLAVVYGHTDTVLCKHAQNMFHSVSVFKKTIPVSNAFCFHVMQTCSGPILFTKIVFTLGDSRAWRGAFGWRTGSAKAIFRATHRTRVSWTPAK